MTPQTCSEILGKRFDLTKIEIKLIEKFLEKNPPINYDWLDYVTRQKYCSSREYGPSRLYNILIFFNYFSWAGSPEGETYWEEFLKKWLTFLAPYVIKHRIYNLIDFRSLLYCLNLADLFNYYSYIARQQDSSYYFEELEN